MYGATNPHPYPMRYNPYRYNPLTRGQKIAIGVGAAAVIGTTVFLLWPKKASAADLPPGPGPTPTPTPSPKAPSKPGTPTAGGKINAPVWPPHGMTPQQAMNAENGVINGVMADSCSTETGLCTRTTDQMRQLAWDELYNVPIPPPAQRGSGWGSWTTAWNRFKATIDDMRPYGQTVFGGGKPIDAPPWPPQGLSSAQAKMLENQMAENTISLHCNFDTHTCDAPIHVMSSEAWKKIPGYGSVKVPPSEKQGTGWKPWIDAWVRINNQITALAESV